MMKTILLVLFTGIITDNVILAKFLGICPFLGVSKKLDSAVGMGLTATLVLVVSTAVTWPLNHFLLEPLGITYLQTLLFIVIIATLVQLMEVLIHFYFPPLYKALGVYLPLVTTNCAMLGITKLDVDMGYAFGKSMIYSTGAGLGFLLAMVLFAGVRVKLENSDIPKTFDGIPITLIAASIMSLSMMGFGGIIEGIFA